MQSTRSQPRMISRVRRLPQDRVMFHWSAALLCALLPADLAGANDAPKSARERLGEYYAKQRAEAPAAARNRDPAADVGRCRIGNTTQFTRRSDCALRGGTFL